MSKYLLPLKVFAGGMLLTLIAFLLLSHVGTAVDQLGTDTAAYAPYFWNWGWISQGNVVKFLLVVFLLVGTFILTFKAFLVARNR